MMKKSLFLLVLCLALVFSLFVSESFAPAAAADGPGDLIEVASGSCGEEVHYAITKETELSEDYTLSVFGSGEVTTITWSSYKTNLKTVLFADTITGFPANAFDGCVNLTSVRLPTALTALPYHAFFNCSALEALTIPDGVKDINSGAFASCPARLYATAGSSAAQELSREGFYFCLAGYDNVRLQYTFDEDDGPITGLKAKAANNTISSVQIPAGVTLIEDNGFYNCDQLQSVAIPAGVTGIGYGAFRDCDLLSDVQLPNSLRRVGNWAFGGTPALLSLTLPNELTELSDHAFSDISGRLYAALGSNTAIALGQNGWSFYVAGNDSVKLRYYLDDAQQITDLTATNTGDTASIVTAVIPDGVTKVEGFYSCGNLTSVSFPASVTRIEGGAFRYCSALTEVSLHPDMAASIGGYALADCASLTAVTIPDGVTSISTQAFLGSPVRLFAHIGSNAARVICEAGKYFYTPGNGNVKLKYSITDGTITGLKATRYDTAIETAVVPAGVTELEASAFSGCANLTSVRLPDGLGAIPSEAFKDCAALTSLTLPASVTGIGSDAFNGCAALSSLTLPDGLERLGNTAFSGCAALTSLTLPDGLTSIDSITFSNYPGRVYATPGSATARTLSTANYWFYVSGNVSVQLQHTVTNGEITATKVKAADTAITQAVIPEGVTTIGSDAFKNCAALETVTIPASVTSIGDRVFDGCTALASLTLPDGLTSISNIAFPSSLRLYATPNSTTAKTLSSSKYWFFVPDNDDVKVQHIVENSEIIGLKAAAANADITSAVIPAQVTQIASDGFKQCSSLTSVDMRGSAVTQIDTRAFYGCSLLADVKLPETLRTINDSAFTDCAALASLTLPDGLTSISNIAFSSSLRLYATPNSTTAKTLSSKYWFFVTGNENVMLQHTVSSGTITATKAKAADTAITQAVIPEGVTAIVSGAFKNCAALVTVTIPAGVTSIGSSAFSGCTALGAVTLPTSVTSIDSGAFPKSHERLSATCGSYAATWLKNNKYPLDAEAEPGSFCWVPVHVWGEAEYVWAAGNASLTATHICVDASHTESETVAAAGVLTKSPTETEAGERLWTSEPFETPAFTVQTRLAADVPALGTLDGLKLPAGLQEIETEAFMDDEALQYVLIPESCGAIGEKAFANCAKLLYVRIPASVAEIAGNAFNGCGAGLVIDRLDPPA